MKHLIYGTGEYSENGKVSKYALFFFNLIYIPNKVRSNKAKMVASNVLFCLTK